MSETANKTRFITKWTPYTVICVKTSLGYKATLQINFIFLSSSNSILGVCEWIINCNLTDPALLSDFQIFYVSSKLIKIGHLQMACMISIGMLCVYKHLLLCLVLQYGSGNTAWLNALHIARIFLHFSSY